MNIIDMYKTLQTSLLCLFKYFFLILAFILSYRAT